MNCTVNGWIAALAVGALLACGGQPGAERADHSSVFSAPQELGASEEADRVQLQATEAGVELTTIGSEGQVNVLVCPWSCAEVTDCMRTACDAAKLRGNGSEVCRRDAEQWRQQCLDCGQASQPSTRCEAHPCGPLDIACYVEHSQLPEALATLMTRASGEQVVAPALQTEQSSRPGQLEGFTTPRRATVDTRPTH